MPPKSSKPPAKAKDSESAKQPDPQTPNERSWHVYWQTNPHEKSLEQRGLHGIPEADRQAIFNSYYLKPGTSPKSLSNKAQKELWKSLSEANVPYRKLSKPTPFAWGCDKYGQDVGDYPLDIFGTRQANINKLRQLTWQSKEFKRARVDPEGPINPSQEDIAAEKARRREMAALRHELYGEKSDPYATDPEWDDVVPIPQVEPEGALAAIAYPEDYAESVSYLRAVMAAKEYSPRCLRLTENVIAMNPAHYTVWLYRFAIVQALDIPIPEEIEWLNAVSLEHLKNYQIWHHRQLLMDHYYPQISSGPEQVAGLAETETAFLMQMLAQDTKNYHVWSYRQYLVRKLGMWGDKERQSIEGMIEGDVRNNSAWSHRFFLVFSDPAHTTPDSHATEPDEKVPSDVIDREIEYAKSKIELAPQNQSPWNYLRGVLTKGARPLVSVQDFVESFSKNLGAESTEEVRSSHSLDLLADAYCEGGEKDKATLCLRRLADRWDSIRSGYWEYRIRLLQG